MRESRPFGHTEVPPFYWFALYRFEWVCRDDEQEFICRIARIQIDFCQLSYQVEINYNRVALSYSIDKPHIAHIVLIV